MKKSLALILAVVMIVGLLAGCGGTEEESKAPASQAPASTAPDKVPESSAPAEVEWPTQTVQLIVPAAAGGNSDIIARVLAAPLEKEIGKPVVIVNQTEGNGVVAYNTVRDADPDGHTLLFHLMTMYAQAATGIYDCEIKTSFTPIVAFTGNSGFAMVVRTDSEFQTAADVAEYIKANPGKLTFGCQLGGTSHMMPAAFANAVGGDFKYVDTGGDADRRTALLGGTVDITLQSCGSVGQYIESGDMRCLGVWTGDGQRDPSAPELETFIELGYDVTWPTTYFCMGPAGMDPELVTEINEAFKVIMDDPETVKQLEEAKFSIAYNDVEFSVDFLNKQEEYINEVCAFLGY